MEDTKFILVYSCFVFMLIYLINQSAVSGIDIGINQTLQPPTCDISGWDALVDAVMCVFVNLSFFFSLMSISTGYTLLGTLIFTPLLATLLWVILKMVRG